MIRCDTLFGMRIIQLLTCICRYFFWKNGQKIRTLVLVKCFLQILVASCILFTSLVFILDSHLKKQKGLSLEDVYHLEEEKGHKCNLREVVKSFREI